MRIEIPKLLASAKDQACICCGSKDGTVVPAHYTGFRQHRFGKGRSIKCHDLFVAFLCKRCHDLFDSVEVSAFPDRNMRKIDQSEQFMFWIMKTWEKLYRDGKIIFT
jgi:hypothetical protein